MEVVELKEFLSLPVGTVFCELDNSELVCSYWNIKEETIEDFDFFYTELPEPIATHLDTEYLDRKILKRGDYECSTRWVSYDNEAKFCVLNKMEVYKLISTLYYTMNTLIKTMEEN